jgi:hypothetical protein
MADIGRFLEEVYNGPRLDSAPGYRSPDELEAIIEALLTRAGRRCAIAGLCAAPAQQHH